MSETSIDLTILSISELNELKEITWANVKKNIFMTSAAVGGKTFGAEREVPTKDMWNAISAEIRRRKGDRVTRTVPRFV